MPHLSFKGLSSEKVEKFAKENVEKLASIIECPVDWINFYDINAKVIMGAEYTDEVCFVTVDWFARNENTKEQVALLITNTLKQYGKSEVIVLFNELDKENYYENMERF